MLTSRCHSVSLLDMESSFAWIQASHAACPNPLMHFMHNDGLDNPVKCSYCRVQVCLNPVSDMYCGIRAVVLRIDNPCK